MIWKAERRGVGTNKSLKRILIVIAIRSWLSRHFLWDENIRFLFYAYGAKVRRRSIHTIPVFVTHRVYAAMTGLIAFNPLQLSMKVMRI